MSDARQTLMAALYAILMDDDALGTVLAGDKVYDHPPRSVALPFVSFGDWESRALDGDEKPSMEHRFEVMVHSRQAGRREASDIGAQVVTLVEGAAPSVPGLAVGAIRHRDTAVGATRDRRAYRVRLRFAAITQEI